MGILPGLLDFVTKPLRWLRRLHDRVRAGVGDPLFPWYWIRRSDDPDETAPRTVYLVGEGAGLWKAVLRCPCGCDAMIQLSLHQVGRPRWVATPHLDGRITLRPSVWRTTGCRSHFILDRGRVYFVGASDRSNKPTDLEVSG